jgi:hypothetical protein
MHFKKLYSTDCVIDFDIIYRDLNPPDIDEARLDAVRADQQTTGGVIRKPMFELLILCEYAVANLTTANANVFYELEYFMLYGR